MRTKVQTKSEVLQILLGVAILFCCTQISIPLKPVPITMKTVGVLLIGLFYQRRQALLTMLSYITLGALGLPVFANFNAYSIGSPTTGYLLGFVAASIVMPLFREWVKKDSSLMMFINCLLGTICIYAFGIAWLTNLFGFEKALQVGLLPFIIPGCVKALLLSQAVRHMKNQNQWKKKAVTLIEMIVVMLLIAMITGALAYNYNASLNEGKAFKTKEAISRIKTILALELAENPERDVSDWKQIVTESPLGGKGDSLMRDGWGGEFQVSLENTDDGQQINVASKNYDSYLAKKKSK